MLLKQKSYKHVLNYFLCLWDNIEKRVYKFLTPSELRMKILNIINKYETWKLRKEDRVLNITNQCIKKSSISVLKLHLNTVRFIAMINKLHIKAPVIMRKMCIQNKGNMQYKTFLFYSYVNSDILSTSNVSFCIGSR